MPSTDTKLLWPADPDPRPEPAPVIKEKQISSIVEKPSVMPPSVPTEKEKSVSEQTADFFKKTLSLSHAGVQTDPEPAPVKGKEREGVSQTDAHMDLQGLAGRLYMCGKLFFNQAIDDKKIAEFLQAHR